MNCRFDDEERVVVRSRDEEEGRIIMDIPYLSQDNIVKILDKVPSIESLFRLRCVCKPWFNIIITNKNSPLLVHPLNSEPPCMIIQSVDNAARKYTRSLPEDELEKLYSKPRTYTTRFLKLVKDERNVEVEQVNVDVSSCFKNTQIIDCFNGLILAEGSSVTDLYIINPVTKQRLKLPPYFGRYFTKFIFIPSTGEYKVLQLVRRPLYSRSYVRILSLFSGGDCVLADEENLKWKFIKVPKYIRIGDHPGKELWFCDVMKPLAINGILYLTSWKDELDRNYVPCFDAREETFYKIAHPGFDPWFNPCRESCWYIELGGLLGYVRFDTSQRPVEDRLHIYTLTDNEDLAADDRKGACREWKKMHSISLAPSILRHRSRDELYDIPVCTLRGGELIIFMTNRKDEQSYRAYDVKFNRSWDLGIDLYPGTDVFRGLFAQRTVPVLASLSY